MIGYPPVSCFTEICTWHMLQSVHPTKLGYTDHTINLREESRSLMSPRPYRLVQRFMVVDKSEISPSPLTDRSDHLYAKEALPVSYFKRRGSLWPSKRTCLCSWSFSCSVWLCFGIFAGSLFGHLPPVGRPSAARCTVFSGPATQMIARPVVWPLLPRQVESLRLCIPGVKSKVGEVHPNASTRRATPVPTGS